MVFIALPSYLEKYLSQTVLETSCKMGQYFSQSDTEDSSINFNDVTQPHLSCSLFPAHFPSSFFRVQYVVLKQIHHFCSQVYDASDLCLVSEEHGPGFLSDQLLESMLFSSLDVTSHLPDEIQLVKEMEPYHFNRNTGRKDAERSWFLQFTTGFCYFST